MKRKDKYINRSKNKSTSMLIKVDLFSKKVDYELSVQEINFF